MTKPALLEVRDVSFRYPKAENFALQSITLSARPGETVGIIGANGAGKTTLTRVITGCVRPSSGEVLISGSEVGRLRSSQFLSDTVGTVQQELSYESNVSVERNLRIYARLLGLTSTQSPERIEAVLSTFALGEYRKKEVSDLSVGNRKRLQVAREMLRIRPIMILDEATAGLDPIIRNRVLSDLQKMARDEHVLVVYTSHNLGEIERLAQKLLVIEGGRSRFWGDPREFVRLVADKARVTISFLGGIPPGLDLARYGKTEIRLPDTVVLYTENTAVNLAALTQELSAAHPGSSICVDPIGLEEAFLAMSG